MSNTTSSPDNRTGRYSQSNVVVSAPGSRGISRSGQSSPIYADAPGSRGLGYNPGITTTFDQKSNSYVNRIPIVEKRGVGERETGAIKNFILEPEAKKRKDLIYINGRVTLFNPETGNYERWYGYYIKKPTARPKASRSGGGGSSSKNKPSQEIPEPAYPKDWKWNLPPHTWSRSVYHATVLDDGSGDLKSKPMPVDSYRRGRLWWKATPDVLIQDSRGVKSATSKNKLDRKYGFQFVWNPETFSTAVSVNMDIYPSVQDRFIGVAGAFPATETITFNIRLDRTNDFACMAHLVPRFLSTVRVGSNESAIDPSTSIYLLDDFVKYYQGYGTFEDSPENIKRKIADLLDRGTIADLEFLYRAINGEGISANQKWVNGRGIATADIGFLMPTLLHVDIGPLAYDGYVTSLQVNHIAFSPEMIPIRTDVSVSLNLLATAGLTTKEVTQ